MLQECSFWGSVEAFLFGMRIFVGFIISSGIDMITCGCGCLHYIAAFYKDISVKKKNNFKFQIIASFFDFFSYKHEDMKGLTHALFLFNRLILNSNDMFSI